MTWNELIKNLDTKRKFLKELFLLSTPQYFAKERVETFVDGLKREQIEKLFENIEDGTKALKEYLESKKQQMIHVIPIEYKEYENLIDENLIDDNAFYLIIDEDKK